MIKPCQRCGILYQSVGNMKYCVDCRPIVYNERDRRYRERHRERFNANHRKYYRRQKLKLIREILSAEAVKRDD